jgi:hypothetical protein
MARLSPLCFASGSDFSDLLTPKRLRDSTFLFNYTPPIINNNIISIDTAIAFFSHLPTVSCPPPSHSRTNTINSDHVATSIKCLECNVNILKITFNIITAQSCITLLRVCSHQDWTQNGKIGQKNIYSSPISFISQHYDTTHPMRRFGKLALKHGHIESIFEPVMRNLVFSQSAIYDFELKSNSEENLVQVLQQFPGNVFVETSPTPIASDDSHQYQFSDEIYFSGLSWLAPWAREAFHESTYIELDGSFYALRPFCFSIPMGIIRNKPIPLGLFIAKSEDQQLFSRFFQMMQSLGIPQEEIQKRGYLCDEGKAIKATLDLNGLLRYSCYRHLIEKIGSNTVLGVITRRLLFCSNQQEYIAKVFEAIAEVTLLFQGDQITDKSRRKFVKIFDFEIDENDEIVLTTLDHHNALWLRIPNRIATCSNHIERLHKTLNDAVGSLHMFCRRLSTVLSEILDWPNTFCHTQNRQEMHVIKLLKETQQKYQITQTETCSSITCGWSEFYSALFQIEQFPCQYTVLIRSPMFEKIPFPPFASTDNNIIINQPIATINQVSQITKPSRQKNLLEVIGDESYSEYGFILETAHELQILFPAKFTTKEFALYYVTKNWTVLSEGDKLFDEDDDETRIEIQSYFRSVLYTKDDEEEES